MKQNTIPTIAVIVTAIAALLLFASSDHSGLSVLDCTLEEDVNQENTYDLNYRLLTGRFFNHLECKYIIYSQNNNIISEGLTKMDKVNMGSYPITEKISLNDTIKPEKVEIIVYHQVTTQENGVNKTFMEKAYSKSINL